MWAKDDSTFLRSIGIAVDQPATPLPPLPRFRAMPGAQKGWYRVVDGSLRKPLLDFSPRSFKEPRLEAESFARMMNARGVSNEP